MISQSHNRCHNLNAVNFANIHYIKADIVISLTLNTTHRSKCNLNQVIFHLNDIIQEYNENLTI